MTETTNYIPYKLLLKGYEKCTFWEKIIWKFNELKHRLMR
jgi:hypothetical protein